MNPFPVSHLHPDDCAPPGGHYSPGCIAKGFVFVSGQLPVTPEGRRLTDAPFADQARQALANVEAVLRHAGTDIAHLVQVRVYIHSLDDWPAFDAVYAAWAGPCRPSRAVVPTGPLHHGLLVEVEAVAVMRDERADPAGGD